MQSMHNQHDLLAEGRVVSCKGMVMEFGVGRLPRYPSESPS